MLSGYALALPLAGLFCVRAAAPASAPLALLLLPLVWSWFAVQGLYNYVLSLPPALVWLGIVARDGVRPRPARRSRWRPSALLVFLAHAVTFSVLLLRHRDPHRLSGRRIARRSTRCRHRRRGSRRRPRRAGAARRRCSWRPRRWRGAVTAPAPFEPTVSRWEMYDFPSAIGAFFVEFAMRYHLIDLAVLGPPLVALIGCRSLARRAGADRRAPRWPLHAAGILALLYLLSPHIVLGSDLTPRLRPLLVFALLCYGGVALSPRARRRVALLALASGLGGAALLAAETSAASAARSTTSRRGSRSCAGGAGSTR